MSTGNVAPGSGAVESEEVPDPRLLEIAARITELQARLGLSWRAFADRAKLSDAHVRLAVVNLEKGKDIYVSGTRGSCAASMRRAWLRGRSRRKGVD